MSDNDHVITEHIAVIEERRLALEDGTLTYQETLGQTPMSHGYCEYECSCGEHFSTYTDAEEHARKNGSAILTTTDDNGN